MIVYREAEECDDAQLTELIASPMPGDLSLSFRREPSYLRSCAECGPPRRVLVAVEGKKILALCSYFLHRYRVGETERELWTVGDFRASPEAAHRSITGRGWVALRQRLGGKPALISVIDQNSSALRLFQKARKGWPSLHKVADLQTFLFPLVKSPSVPEYGVVKPCRRVMVSALRRWTRSHLSPVWNAESLPPSETLTALSSGTELTAVAALWDRESHRQWQVAGYAGDYAKLSRLGLLPGLGQRISVTSVGFLAGRDLDSSRDLFLKLHTRARRQGHDILVFSQDAQKERPFPKWWPRLSYPSTLYQLLWSGDEEIPFAAADYPVCWL